MRFMGRNADKITLKTADDVLQSGEWNLSQRTEELLGIETKKAKVGRKEKKKAAAKEVAKEEEIQEHSLDEGNMDPGSIMGPEKVASQRQQELAGRKPTTRGAMSVWPNVERENRSHTDLLNAGVYQPTRYRPGIPERKTSTNAVHNYYDPARQPTYVSQQTSASAVRDMGLRKGAPMMHETTSDPALGKRLPLKSAMKKRRPEELLRVRTNSNEKPERKPKRLDLSQLFPPSRSQTANLLSPNKLSHSPSALTDASDIFATETVHTRVKRPAANARFETLKTVRMYSSESVTAARTKVFEPDIFDQAKTNVRRPPKGIQNWFDGFDISSDDDAETETEAQVATPTHELPADEPPLAYFKLKPDSEQPQLNRKASKDPVEDNLLAIEHAKERMHERMRMVGQRKGSVDSSTIVSVISSEAPSRKAISRIATSRLASESVLSLSESSEDNQVDMPRIRESVSENDIVAANEVHIIKPVATPRKLQSKRSLPRESFPRQSSSTMQTSGSIPIRLTDSIPVPPIPMPPTPTATQRNTQTSYNDPTLQALRKLNGESVSSPPRSRRTTKTSAPDYAESAATGESAGSLPMDPSHFMAVTEEEALLLEMMRRKRAMMAKNSFTEGYQLALKREQEHLAKRRESAQQTALKILRQKEDRVKSQRNSRVVEVADLNSGGLNEWQRRKYSAIRKEDVDKALKLERFLSSAETPTVDAFPEPPTHDASSDGNSRRTPQKFQLLLPDTYSPTPSRTLEVEQPVSAGGSSPLPEEEDIEDHHHRVRAFLASNNAAEGASMFPTPPTSRSRTDLRREKRVSVVSPSPVAEEDSRPSVPKRSPRRPSLSPRTTDTSIQTNATAQGERYPSRQEHVNKYRDMEQRGTPTQQDDSPQDQPYFITHNLDFAPLDFPPCSRAPATTTSPSLSASRASPLTPSFVSVPTPSSDHLTVEERYLSSDNERSARTRGAYTPDTDLNSLLSTSVPTPKSTKKHAGNTKSSATARLNVVGGARNSVASSLTSAGEDVLAAWSALGGGSEAAAVRRRIY